MLLLRPWLHEKMATPNPPSTSVWEAMDVYYRDAPEGTHALNPKTPADKQLQEMAEAVINGRPHSISLDTLVEPNQSFKTKTMDTKLDFNRFIDVLRLHNRLEPLLQNPVYHQATDPNHPLHKFLREHAVRAAPDTRAERNVQARLVEEGREQGVRAHAHLDRAKASTPPEEHQYIDDKLSDRYPDPKKPFGKVHGSVANNRRLEIYDSAGSKQTGAIVVVAMIADVPHYREIGAAAIGMYSFLVVKKHLPHHRNTLNIALWHAEIEMGKGAPTASIPRSKARRKQAEPSAVPRLAPSYGQRAAHSRPSVQHVCHLGRQ
ncbi:hypothetical protein QFC22_001212 [Naganishia vaughanmartiniae]|uniref:Uncharacterized protein n=1 Tax=Naganishia vaughanmartiniae TaxID=1424756 RepID=A0ACC2XM13_9TREE|nr:hypothetical protein QFC22_001212 [Naganishia vaughanmartiniae]